MTKEREYRAPTRGRVLILRIKPPVMRTRSTSWLWPRRGSAWLIVFSGLFPKATLVRCIRRFGQSWVGDLDS